MTFGTRANLWDSEPMRQPRYLADHDAAPRRLRLQLANYLKRLTVEELRNSDSFDGLKQFLKTILVSRYIV